MGITIYAVDSTMDGTLYLDRFTLRDNAFVVSVDSVPDMVRKVLNLANRLKISNLVIIGHGKSGRQMVGAGENYYTRRNDQILAMEYPDFSNNWKPKKLRGQNEIVLVQLRGAFEKDAIVSLHGCGVAGGLPTNDSKFLRRLSHVLGVMVEGAISDHQLAVPGYEGPVLRCNSSICWKIPAGVFH